MCAVHMQFTRGTDDVNVCACIWLVSLCFLWCVNCIKMTMLKWHYLSSFLSSNSGVHTGAVHRWNLSHLPHRSFVWYIIMSTPPHINTECKSRYLQVRARIFLISSITSAKVQKFTRLMFVVHYILSICSQFVCFTSYCTPGSNVVKYSERHVNV